MIAALALFALSAHDPIALAPGQRAGELFAACADGVLVRVESYEVTGTWQVASALSDLIALEDGGLAATDPDGDALLVLAGTGTEVTRRVAVARPSSVLAAGDELVVASTWGRTLTRARDGATLALSFGPREMLATLDGATVIVADAFGGSLAVVDVAAWRLIATHELPAHNIGALAWSADGELLVAHQILDTLAHTAFDDVHWGNLMRNVVREVDMRSLSRGTKGTKTSLLHLGDVGQGAADPSTLLVDEAGRYVVALGGTDELLTLDPSDLTQQRVRVGRRPVAALSLDDGRTIAVANALDASLTFVDVESGATTYLTLGPRPDTGDPAALGRRLFFDARLSHDGWMSCHSCHTEGHSPDLLADTLSDESFGTPKRIPSLLGAATTAPFAWNGSQPTLEAQIAKTLKQTMHTESLAEDSVAALAAFLRSLPPPPAGFAASSAAGPAVERGRAHFAAGGCTDCHAPPLFTSPDTYTVGLTDETGADTFNPPSLRGVGGRARLFHDGRFRRIEDLLARAEHQGSEELDEEGRADVAAYLRTL
jgi:hypothetical protein